ncbi:hypothetical protein [Kitasatospora sp. NPDC094015]|uniref:LppU/SCO3897 family protein n=1 Tax=Kitasatospora sp. NPDC094015 TaxID=3155205 RepID=UPI00333004CE
MLLLLLVGFLAVDGGPARPAAGDCVRIVGRTDLDKVACTDPNADHRVLARFDASTDIARCSGVPGTTAQYRGSTGRRWHKRAYVLCLGPLAGTGAPAERA